MSPFRIPFSSTRGRFSILFLCRMASALSSVVPTGAVMRFAFVMTSSTRRSRFVSKRRSLFVRMPRSLPFASVTGTPEIRNLIMALCASPMVLSGFSVMGSLIMALSERFTLSTSLPALRSAGSGA
jgi:hypothetical protein